MPVIYHDQLRAIQSTWRKHFIRFCGYLLAGQVFTNQVKECLFLALRQSEREINPGNERYRISEVASVKSRLSQDNSVSKRDQMK